MLLNNGRRAFNWYQQGKGGTMNSYTALNGGSQKFSDDNAITAICGGVNIILSSYYNTSNPWAGIDVGFGDTPVSAEDYTLADSNFTNRQLEVVACGRNTGALGDIMNLYVNFRNSGNSNVVVKEIGVVGNATSSSTGARSGLFWRKVLDTPVTIGPGEVYAFNYRVRIKDA